MTRRSRSGDSAPRSAVDTVAMRRTPRPGGDLTVLGGSLVLSGGPAGAGTSCGTGLVEVRGRAWRGHRPAAGRDHEHQRPPARRRDRRRRGHRPRQPVEHLPLPATTSSTSPRTTIATSGSTTRRRSAATTVGSPSRARRRERVAHPEGRVLAGRSPTPPASPSSPASSSGGSHVGGLALSTASPTTCPRRVVVPRADDGRYRCVRRRGPPHLGVLEQQAPAPARPRPSTSRRPRRSSPASTWRRLLHDVRGHLPAAGLLQLIAAAVRP